jgi:hypothetical protein
LTNFYDHSLVGAALGQRPFVFD